MKIVHKLLSIALVSSGLLTVQPAATHAARADAAVHSVSAAEYRAFLSSHYGISLSAEPTRGEYIQDVARTLGLHASGTANPFQDLKPDSPYYSAALALYENGILTGDTVLPEQPLTEDTAVYIAVKAADLKELAYSYPVDKVQASLKAAHLEYAGEGDRKLTLQAAQELAAAFDSGLVQDQLKPGAAASDDFAASLLGSVLSVKGQYKHYLAYVSDSDVYSQVYKAYQTADLIQVPALQSIVDEALKQNLVTGYNLKDDRFSANFDPALSLTYGHDDLSHALQLIGLMRSEGLDAKVQLEPKTSAFVYLKEWGEPKETESYKVVQIENGNYIAYAKEYDLAFEFDTPEQKARFQDIVLKYAKKNEKDQTGLIKNSWWQPLYYSLTELKDYKEIANNKISSGHYYAQSFSLKDKSAEITAGLQKIKPGTQVTSYRFWVDEPFYNYLLGEYK